MMSYQGVDLSHWNQPEDMWKHINPNFVICKASEGKTVKDWTCKRYYIDAFCNNLSYGLYHFAHPEKNNVDDEFNNFNEVAETFPEEVIEFIALDVEGNALKASKLDLWCRDWLLKAKALYPKATTLLYCSQAECKRFQLTSRENDLWVARYRKFELGYGDVSPWTQPLIWQYDSKGVDKNIFYMKGDYNHEKNTDQEEERPQNLYADCKGN